MSEKIETLVTPRKSFPKPSDNMVTIKEPESAAAEAFRILRTNISLRDFDGKIKVINVISSVTSESKSTTIANLAYVYSQMEKKVLLIDLDLRASSLHKKLRLKNNVGVSEVLSNACLFQDAVINYAPNLDVLLAGKKNPYASELLESKAFKNFLAAVKDVYDLVLLDCPPVGIVSDGIIVSSMCDGTLLCVASNVVDKKELEHTRDLLNNIEGINVLGIVMTRTERSKKYYGSSYGYGYGYGNSKKK